MATEESGMDKIRGLRGLDCMIDQSNAPTEELLRLMKNFEVDDVLHFPNGSKWVDSVDKELELVWSKDEWWLMDDFIWDVGAKWWEYRY